MDKIIEVLTKVGPALWALVRFLWPLANARTREIVGTALVCLAVVGAIAADMAKGLPPSPPVMDTGIVVPADVPLPPPVDAFDAEPDPAPADAPNPTLPDVPIAGGLMLLFGGAPSGRRRSAAVVGALLLGLLTLPSCRTITPAIQAGGAFLQDGYGRYVKADPVLTDTQRAERWEIVCNHNRLLGNPVPADCPPAPEVK